MPIPDYKGFEKYCLNCGELLILNNNRDIKRKNFCSHNCCAKYYSIKQNRIPPRPTKETRLKADKTRSRKMKLGLIPKPPKSTIESMRKAGLKKRRENHPNWIKDRTKLKKKRYDCSERDFLESIRKDVFERDNYTCQITGIKGERLEVHHIYNWADNIDKRQDLDNMITLSKNIHKKFHKIYGRRNNNLIQFIKFKKEEYYASAFTQTK